MYRKLENITAADIQLSTSPAPLNGMNTDAKMMSVYDGDTCDLVIIRKKKLEWYKCRLADINAPELKEGPKAEKSRLSCVVEHW